MFVRMVADAMVACTILSCEHPICDVVITLLMFC